MTQPHSTAYSKKATLSRVAFFTHLRTFDRPVT